MKKYSIVMIVIMFFIKSPLLCQIVCNANFCYQAEIDSSNRLCITTHNLSTSNDSIVHFYWNGACGFTGSNWELNNICWPSYCSDTIGLTLVITTLNNCTSTISELITVGATCDSLLQIISPNDNPNIEVYYSVIYNSIVLKNTKSKNILRFYLFNIFGKIVLTDIAINDNALIENISLPSGIYYYRIIEQYKILETGKLFITKK